MFMCVCGGCGGGGGVLKLPMPNLRVTLIFLESE